MATIRTQLQRFWNAISPPDVLFDMPPPCFDSLRDPDALAPPRNKDDVENASAFSSSRNVSRRDAAYLLGTRLKHVSGQMVVHFPGDATIDNRGDTHPDSYFLVCSSSPKEVGLGLLYRKYGRKMETSVTQFAARATAMIPSLQSMKLISK
jgi:hypothetical protein